MCFLGSNFGSGVFVFVLAGEITTANMGMDISLPGVGAVESSEVADSLRPSTLRFLVYSFSYVFGQLGNHPMPDGLHHLVADNLGHSAGVILQRS